ncbi:MAG: hypothetical protein NZ894_05890 [Archaeoglobaceae archaeon]|nr:hypothetical protein [Archaeoglobaceae archaeon]
MEFEYREYAKRLFEKYLRKSDPHFAIHYKNFGAPLPIQGPFPSIGESLPDWAILLLDDIEMVLHLKLCELPVRTNNDVNKEMCKIEAGPYLMNLSDFFSGSIEKTIRICIERMESVRLDFCVKIIKNVPGKVCVVRHFENYFLLPPLNKNSGYIWVLERDKNGSHPLLSELQPLKLTSEEAIDLMFSIL